MPGSYRLIALCFLLFPVLADAEEIPVVISSIEEHRILHHLKGEWVRNKKPTAVETYFFDPLQHVATLGMDSPYDVSGKENLTILNLSLKLPSDVRAYGRLRINSLKDDQQRELRYLKGAIFSRMRVADKPTSGLALKLPLTDRGSSSISRIDASVDLLRGEPEELRIPVHSTQQGLAHPLLEKAGLDIRIKTDFKVPSKMKGKYHSEIKLEISGNKDNLIEVFPEESSGKKITLRHTRAGITDNIRTIELETWREITQDAVLVIRFVSSPVITSGNIVLENITLP